MERALYGVGGEESEADDGEGECLACLFGVQTCCLQFSLPYYMGLSVYSIGGTSF